MGITDIHKQLQNLCNLGIVNKEYIDVRILLAVLPIPEEEVRGYLITLEKSGYISTSGDTGLKAHIDH